MAGPNPRHCATCRHDGGAIMPDPTVATPNAGTLFGQARDSFFMSISSAERQNLSGCSTIDEVLSRIENLSSLSKAKKRILPCLEKVKSFGDNLSTYFKVLEIFCASNPEWANLALGSLFLVLQVGATPYLLGLRNQYRILTGRKLSSNFVNFFERLCDTIEEISARMPRYQELYDTFASSPGAISPALRTSMLRVYGHIFDFYTAVARVFSKQCGSTCFRTYITVTFHSGF